MDKNVVTEAIIKNIINSVGSSCSGSKLSGLNKKVTYLIEIW